MTTPWPAPPRPPRRRLRRRTRVIIGVVAGALLIFPATIATLVLVSYTGAKVDTAGKVAFDTRLAIPPIAASTVDAQGVRNIDLRLQQGTTDFGIPGGDGASATMGINGSYLGPTIRARRGEALRMHVTNALEEESTLHWHGMHLPAKADGGPHQMVRPGATWTPEWTVNQPAATLWYHPHLHGTTAHQVFKGLAGMVILDDDQSPSALPHEYGVDDIPMIVQDRNVGDDGQLDEGTALMNSVGTTGKNVLVNGTYGAFVDVTTQRVRLRLLNASNARTYRFALTNGDPMTQIATDGGLIEKPITQRSLVLSPGERAEVVVQLDPGERTVLRSLPFPEVGDVLQRRWSGGEDTLDVLQLRAAATLAPSPAVPAYLGAGSDLDEDDVTTVRQFDLSGTSINNQKMDMGRIDETVEVGTTEAWQLHNTDGRQHSFHVHDVQFRVVSYEGRPPPPHLTGPKDTILLPANARAVIILRFADYTDPDVPYMFHCHLLRHEDQGMMGQFVVVRPGERAGTPPVTGHEDHEGADQGADRPPTLAETRARIESNTGHRH